MALEKTLKAASIAAVTAAALTAILTAGRASAEAAPQGPDATSELSGRHDPAAQLRALSDGFMTRYLEHSPYLQMMSGARVDRMPDNTATAASALAEFAGTMLSQLASIDPGRLSHDDRLTYRMLRGQLELMVEGEPYFWHQFNITPYAVGLTFSTIVPSVLATAELRDAGDADAYLAFLEDIGRYLEDDLVRLQGQAQRGILLPKAAIPGARTALAGTLDTVRSSAVLTDSRLASLPEAQRERLVSDVPAIINDRVAPAVAALLAYLGPAYSARAPDAVGLHQYPGGAEAYRFAIRSETTMDLDPEDIHERGLAYMAEIQGELAAIREELGFEGSQEAFHERLWSDPRFFAKSPEQVAERYRGYLRRIEPHIPRYFSVLPEAPYGVKRLDPAAEPGMTFGYYQAPTPEQPKGYYRFNGSKLESRPMIWTGALIYHELVPGHHFHIALQQENESFSQFRASTAFMYAAFTEGWANYAASLANEMGLFDDPYERYGWLLFDAFITNRLVVDTGMNHLGWSLEKARAYMKANTFSSQEEIDSETLRYATDLPAQALAYKLGYEKLLELRRRQQVLYGDDFDIRKFHAATVGSGAMPLPLLEEHVDWYLRQ